MVYRGNRRTEAARPACGVRVTGLANWTKLTKSELRAAQIKILNSFADFCTANSLSYYLYAGTLLGTVRHQGYIPWDDDIDVTMPRRDYDRLHSIASAQGAINGFSLCSPSLTPGFPWPFAKIADNPGTLVLEENGNDYRIGINIDVFPLDGWPTGVAVRWVHGTSIRLLRGLIYSHHSPPSFKGSNLRESVLVLAKPVAKRISLDWLIRKISARASRYSTEDSGLAGVVVWDPELVPTRAYSEVAELPFEKRRYRAPGGYDIVLSAMYGNYLQLPPPELRVSPHGIEAFRSAK